MNQPINTNYDVDPYDDELILGRAQPVLVKSVNAQQIDLAADFGAFQAFTLPQAAIGVVPVQMLQRRPYREEAYVLNSGTTADTYTPSQQVYGTATSPAAGAVIANMVSLPAGIYTISWQVELQGTTAAGTDNDNFKLENNTLGTTILQSVNPFAIGGPYIQPSITVVLTQATHVTIQAVATATAGAVYSASFSATPIYSLGAGTTQTSGFPIVVSQRPDTLQSAVPIGLTLSQGGIIKIVSQQPLYGVAIGGIQAVSVIDESWDVGRVKQ
jgi:hypothetical protein